MGVPVCNGPGYTLQVLAADSSSSGLFVAIPNAGLCRLIIYSVITVDFFTFAILLHGEVSDAIGTPLEVVERARLVHRTPLEKVCIRPQRGPLDKSVSRVRERDIKYSKCIIATF